MGLDRTTRGKADLKVRLYDSILATTAFALPRRHLDSIRRRIIEVAIDTPIHQHTPQEERRIREAALDETIAESFPASDPPSSLPNPDDHDADDAATAEKAPPNN